MIAVIKCPVVTCRAVVDTIEQLIGHAETHRADFEAWTRLENQHSGDGNG